MPLFLPSSNENKNPALRAFSEKNFFKLIQKKKIISIDLSDKPYPEYREEYYSYQRKFEFITHEIETLQFTNDTASLLKVELGEDNTYGEFIWLLNQTKLYQIRRFAVIGNCIYFLTNPAPIHYPPIEYFGNDVLSVDQAKLSKWQVLKQGLKSLFEETSRLIRYNYFFSSGFFLLILVPAIIRVWNNIFRKKIGIHQVPPA